MDFADLSAGDFFGVMRGRQVPADAPGDPRRGGLKGGSGEVRVSGDRVNLGGTKQPVDHREALARARARVAYVCLTPSSGRVMRGRLCNRH